jgi:hypothetical protein
MTTENHGEEISREQILYWQELVQLKADSCYVRDYRNAVGKWVTGIAALRAVTSASSIAIWAVWKEHAYVWASLIALAQVADALKDVFPLYKKQTALSRWSGSLNRLFVDAQRDWDDIAGGSCTNQQIRRTLHKLRLRKQAAEAKWIPNGLAMKQRLFEAAQMEAVQFFRKRYNTDEE